MSSSGDCSWRSFANDFASVCAAANISSAGDIVGGRMLRHGRKSTLVAILSRFVCGMNIL